MLTVAINSLNQSRKIRPEFIFGFIFSTGNSKICSSYKNPADALPINCMNYLKNIIYKLTYKVFENHAYLIKKHCTWCKMGYYWHIAIFEIKSFSCKLICVIKTD